MNATIISDGITYLEGQQQKDGSFLSLSSPKQTNFDKAFTYHTTFFTSLILLAINDLPVNPQLKQIKAKAAKFLLSQKSTSWSWNYWDRTASETKTMPYPDDLDDTFCALAGLFQHDAKSIDAAAMAKIVTLLLATETTEGGPYQTWLVNKNADPKWHDVDLAVNSNIAYFLLLNDIDLPNLTVFIESRIENNTIRSPYYPSIYPLAYFISRFYHGEKVMKLQKILLRKRQQNTIWKNPLLTALAVSSLLNLGLSAIELKTSIDYLIAQQQKHTWQPYAFCLDPAKNSKKYYAGSAALTTAFCLEALAKYAKALHRTTTVLRSQPNDAKAEYIYKQVLATVNKRYANFDAGMKKTTLIMLNKLFEKDTQKQIVLLPYYFAQTLAEKDTIADDLLKNLGVANVMGWLAYTIYDYFLDDEADPQLLPIATVALRELTKIFATTRFSNKKEFVDFFHLLIDQLDNANSWEVTNCRIKVTKGNLEIKSLRLPDYKSYKQLAQKSLGHSLGPVAILYSLGYTKKSPEVKSFLSFFKHYLIARQLNDDAHDWEKDLRLGQINPVVCLLLQQVYKKELENNETISLKKLLPKLQKIFWYTTIKDVAALVYTHTKKARAALNRCPVVTNQAYFEQLLVRYEHAVQKAVDESQDAILFLKTYK